MDGVERLAVVFFLTVIIHMVDTFSYSVRIAGVRTKRLALALSLFNIIVLFSRTANMIQAPLLGSLVDYSIAKGDRFSLSGEFRLIILAATVGTVIGALLIPTFVNIFTKGIEKLENTGSIPRLLFSGTSLRSVKAIRHNVAYPNRRMFETVRLSGLPKTFLLINVGVTAIYTIGILASIYSGVLLPEYRLTASQLSGLVNGVATILFVILVDPKAAMITDQAMQEIRKPGDVNAMVAMLVGGKIVGTLLAQLIFLPAAYMIVYFTSFIIH